MQKASGYAAPVRLVVDFRVRYTHPHTNDGSEQYIPAGSGGIGSRIGEVMVEKDIESVFLNERARKPRESRKEKDNIP